MKPTSLDAPRPEDALRVVGRTCPLCEATCGLRLSMRGDTVVRVQGDPDDVFSQGFICPKGAALGALHHDPDRLRTPRIRKGPSDDPASWVEVDWPEAFAAVEAGLAPILARGDRDAVAFYAGNPSAHGLAGPLFIPGLIKTLGTRNMFSASTVDQMPHHVASGLMFGHPDLMPVPDIDRTDLLVIFGANPLVSNGSIATAPDWPGRLRRIVERGQAIVFDPRRTATAAAATEHVPIRPGTDAYVVLAMVQTVLAEGPTVPAHLSAHVVELDGLAEQLAPFTPEVAEGVSGVPAPRIRALAQAVLSTPRAAVYGRIGASTTQFGTLTAWGIYLLNLLAGSLDVEGGVMFPRGLHGRPDVGRGRGFRIGRRHGRTGGHPEVRGELPAVTLADEILTPGDGQVRALITFAGNPVLSLPGGPRLDEALDSLEFMVSVDPYLNETTRRAHVILPPPAPLARSHYDLAFYRLSVREVARYTPASVAAAGPQEHEILARLTLIAAGAGANADPAVVEQMVLGHILGSAVRTPGPVHGRKPAELMSMLEGDDIIERALDALIRTGPWGDAFGDTPDGFTLAKLAAAPHGVDLGPLTRRLPQGLATRDGRLHAAPETIVADLPRLTAALAERQAADASGVLRLIGRRHLRSNNSWMHNLPKLSSGRGRCALQMHPDDAAVRGLEAGERVSLGPAEGSDVAPIEVELSITDAVMPGVVCLPHGWGHAVEGTALRVARSRPGVNINAIIDSTVMDPLSGNAALNGMAVRVSRAAAG